MNTRERRSTKRREGGFVLFLGVLIMAFLLLLAVPFLFQLNTEQRLTEKSAKSFAAVSLAEAGIERAIWELNNGDISTWQGDTNLRTMTISDFEAAGGRIVGDIEIRVENPDSGYPVIESTGRVAFAEFMPVARITRVVMRSQGCHPVFDRCVFGSEGVDMSANAFIDSYDSRNGLYGGSNVSSEGHVGTNAMYYGCISLSNGAKVYGSAFSGPESNPAEVIVTWSKSHIFGPMQALVSSKALPSVLPPEGLMSLGDYNLASGGNDVIIQSGEYDSFTINSNAKTTIADDVILYIKGNFEIASLAKLEIADDASSRIYLGGGTFYIDSDSQIINLTQDPKKLLILGTDNFDSTVELALANDFYGAVYAPRANLNCYFGGKFYGSLVARKISLKYFSEIHYDKALAEMQFLTAGKGSIYGVRSWQLKFSPHD